MVGEEESGFRVSITRSDSILLVRIQYTILNEKGSFTL